MEGIVGPQLRHIFHPLLLQEGLVGPQHLLSELTTYYMICNLLKHILKVSLYNILRHPTFPLNLFF